jgi:BclB C-terminal domain-containing protein
MSIDEREGMDKRPQVLWRRRSVFVAVVLAVMIGSTVSVLAATGSPSAKRYYACVAGRYKTLNLTTAGATCPEGQRKISFGEGGRGLNGAAGATGPKGQAGSKGATGAPGPEGKAGAVGPEGKAGPEGKQGPGGTGGGSPGPEGKEGAQGSAGPEGTAGLPGPVGPVGPRGEEGPIGPQGHEGPPGPQGDPGPTGPEGDGTIVYAASSGEPVVPTTLVGGLSGQVAVLPLDGDQAGMAELQGSVLDLTGGGGQIVPAQTFPTDETIQSITLFSSTTAALSLVGTTVTVSAQLYTSTTPNNTFAPVPGTLVTASPPLTGVDAIGTISNGITTGLSIPVTAGTRGVIVVSVTAAGLTLVNAVPMYAGASISAS